MSEAEHGGQESSKHWINLENEGLENKFENTAVLYLESIAYHSFKSCVQF